MAEKAVPALATGLQLLGPELIPEAPCLHAGAAGSHWGRGMGRGGSAVGAAPSSRRDTQ